MANKGAKEIPVYLFTGFLESGKTTFIQDSLADPQFNEGEPTLLLLCEEGEMEYDLSRFAHPNVQCRTIQEQEELNEMNLARLQQETGAERVLCEYNGMWLLDAFYNAMPPSWRVFQEVFFADAGSILTYNANMRQLTFDKLQSCEMAVFNRCGENTDRLELHKLVRTASRSAEIIYESKDGSLAYDDIQDPLPFDLNADIIDIKPEDYALWYRDLSAETDKYEGKTVRFLGRALTKKTMPSAFIIGRHVMTCCVEDIQFAGLVCLWDKANISKLAADQWVELTATVSNQYHKIYKEKGPVLTALSLTPASKPDPEVASFY